MKVQAFHIGFLFLFRVVQAAPTYSDNDVEASVREETFPELSMPQMKVDTATVEPDDFLIPKPSANYRYEISYGAEQRGSGPNVAIQEENVEMATVEPDDFLIPKTSVNYQYDISYGADQKSTATQEKGVGIPVTSPYVHPYQQLPLNYYQYPLSYQQENFEEVPAEDVQEAAQPTTPYVYPYQQLPLSYYQYSLVNQQEQILEEVPVADEPQEQQETAAPQTANPFIYSYQYVPISYYQPQPLVHTQQAQKVEEAPITPEVEEEKSAAAQTTIPHIYPYHHMPLVYYQHPLGYYQNQPMQEVAEAPTEEIKGMDSPAPTVYHPYTYYTHSNYQGGFPFHYSYSVQMPNVPVKVNPYFTCHNNAGQVVPCAGDPIVPENVPAAVPEKASAPLSQAQVVSTDDDIVIVGAKR